MPKKIRTNDKKLTRPTEILENVPEENKRRRETEVQELVEAEGNQGPKKSRKKRFKYDIFICIYFNYIIHIKYIRIM